MRISENGFGFRSSILLSDSAALWENIIFIDFWEMSNYQMVSQGGKREAS